MTPYICTNEHGLHKSNGPARVWDEGWWVWALNGMTHRYYGPALEDDTWSLHGENIKHGDT